MIFRPLFAETEGNNYLKISCLYYRGTAGQGGNGYPRLSGRAGEINMDMEVLRGRQRLDNKNLP